jgi:hypothetical protein
MNGNPSSKPLVIVLDMDGTIIGDIRPQLQLVELHKSLKAQDKKVNVLNIKDFQSRLRSGIVRPYFSKFVKKLKEHNTNVEFFVYTASEKKWAHFLVPQIEKAAGVKFNRPIFTRDDCTSDYKKTVSNIMGGIFKSLKKRYGVLKKKDMEDRIVIVDNTSEVFDQNNQRFLIHCPTYDFKYPENIPSHISSNVFETHQTVITTCLNMRGLPGPGMSGSSGQICRQYSYLDFQTMYYPHYVNVLTSVNASNKNHLKDKFFAHFLELMVNKQISSFTPKTISYLRSKLSSSQ